MKRKAQITKQNRNELQNTNSTNRNLSVIHFHAQDRLTNAVEDTKGRDEYVKWGDNDNYFNEIRECYLNSSTNSSIINNLSLLGYGAGLNSPEKSSKLDQWLAVKNFVSDDDLRRCINDLVLNGATALQLIKSDGDYINAYHFPVETLRAKRLLQGQSEVSGYYYCSDWKDSRQRSSAILFPSFGYGYDDEQEILYIKNYVSGYFYYSPVSYNACLPYAKIEKELGEFHLSEIEHGFSANTLVNMNNGTPTEEQKREIEGKFISKFSGVKSPNKIVLAFNDSVENQATVTSLSVANAHDRYNSLEVTAMNKIIMAHSITSPILLGIRDGSGLGNNADELKDASKLLEANKLNPMRRLLIENLNKVLKTKGINITLYFESLNPFKEEDNNNADVSQMSAIEEVPYFTLDNLGVTEESLSDYELISNELVTGDDDDDLEEFLNNNIKAKKGLLSSIISNFSNEDSYQDTEFFKVRYKYLDTAKRRIISNDSRDICSQLMSAGMLYTKEEIKSMSSKGGAEAQGEQYDVFLYKGGANCRHGWERRIYKKKTKKDGTPWGGGAMNGVTASDVADALKDGAKINKNIDKRAYKAPADTKTRGYKK